MSYEVRFTPAADRQVDKLPRAVRPKIIARAEALADNPRPHGVKMLTNAAQGTYRVREGDYRIVYDIERCASRSRRPRRSPPRGLSVKSG